MMTTISKFGPPRSSGGQKSRSFLVTISAKKGGPKNYVHVPLTHRNTDVKTRVRKTSISAEYLGYQLVTSTKKKWNPRTPFLRAAIIIQSNQQESLHIKYIPKRRLRKGKYGGG
jgi:hypothetical protein